MDEMLNRINEAKDPTWMTTDEVRHVFNDCHVVTVYKMNARKELTPYRRRSTGPSNYYRRDQVESAVRRRFQLVQASSDSTGSDDGAVYETGVLRGARGRPRKSQNDDTKPRRKAKRRNKPR